MGAMGAGVGSAGERPSAAKHEAHSSVSTMSNRQLPLAASLIKAKLGVVTEPRGGLEGLSLQCQEVLILEQARRQVRVKGAEDGCVDAPGLGPTAEICDGGTRLPCGCGVGARATPFVPGGLREVGLCEVRV